MRLLNYARLKSILGAGCLVIWSLIVVDGLFPQLQIALFERRVPIPSVALKAALTLVLILVAVLVALRGRPVVPKRFLLLWGVFVAYLIADALILAGRFSYPLGYILFSYNSYYFFLIILPLIFLLRGTLSESTVVLWVALLFLPLAGLGIAQNVLDDQIVPVESADRYFEVNAGAFVGHVRGFSLFTSASNAGHYVALAGALGVAFLYGRRTETKLAGLALVVLAAAAGYATLTRATYLEVPMAMAAAFLIAQFGRTFLGPFLSLLPIVYGLVGAFVAFVLSPLVGTLSGTGNILDQGTILMRYQQWSTYLERWLGEDTLTAIFGTGIIQNSRFPITEDVLIDSSFLALGVHIGLLGLVIWVALMWELWRYVLRIARERNGPLAVAVAAAWSTWMVTGVFGIVIVAYLMLLMLLMLGLRTERPPDSTTEPIPKDAA